MKILVFNAGSSSHKIRLYEIKHEPGNSAPKPIWSGDADWGQEKSQAELKIAANGQTIQKTLPTTSRTEVIKQLLETLWSGQTRVIDNLNAVSIVGHRVVHGGPDYQKSVRVTPRVKETIKHLATFAPLHNPANLEGIEAIEKIKSNMPQMAVFDTAFHSTLPREVATYPGPYGWFEKGIRRYGFHGISHEYCTQRSAEILGRDPAEIRLINCHLGNGCSIAAIRNGKSVDTTMGFTPLEGLMMGTRSGTIDPSILLYLQREQGYDVEKLDHILNKEAGLLGISGLTGDMRSLWKAVDEGNERAMLAIDIFIYRLRYFIGAMAASQEGIDVLTFTGGIGENDDKIRAHTCSRLEFLQLKLDQQKNAAGPVDQDIATADSRVRILVVHTEEDWEIARECWKEMQKQG